MPCCVKNENAMGVGPAEMGLSEIPVPPLAPEAAPKVPAGPKGVTRPPPAGLASNPGPEVAVALPWLPPIL